MTLFQSTPPSRVATIRQPPARINHTFQSTPPSRVATMDVIQSWWGNWISIHTTLAGGDRPLPEMTSSSLYFNPHHPRGWRHHKPVTVNDNSGFQSTPPSRVATRAGECRGFDGIISIHTTLAGGDEIPRVVVSCYLYFNPHHPRGWRLLISSLCSSRCYFNPHHPRGWRLQKTKWYFLRLPISIHTTLAGGDSKNGREIHPFSIPIKA